MATSTNIANLNTVANNVTGVKFLQKDIGTSSDPTSSLDAGDLAFNTTGNNQLKYYDGSSWNTVAAQDTQVQQKRRK